MTQAQIESSVDWAIANLKGYVTDEYGGYRGECVSLMRREYIHRTGEKFAPNTPNGWGDGYIQLPGTFAKNFRVETFNRNRDYPKGSYAINVPSHHIMIYLNRAGNNAVVFEQNADPDGAPAHVYTRDGSRISHILVPITTEGEEDMPASAEFVMRAYRNILNTTYKATDQPIKDYVGQPELHVIQDMMTWAEKNGRDFSTVYAQTALADVDFVKVCYEYILNAFPKDDDQSVQSYIGAPKDYVVRDMAAWGRKNGRDFHSVQLKLAADAVNGAKTAAFDQIKAIIEKA